MDVSLSRRIHREGGLERLSVGFRCAAGSWIGLAGPSGCGKTTVLRMIAGLDRPQTGYVHADGRCWFSRKDRIWIPVHQRRCGFVFQKPALFPHLTVLQNIQYGCAASSFAAELLYRAGLDALAHRAPCRAGSNSGFPFCVRWRRGRAC
jgi:molybdate transport system ATP-binding protein